MADAQARGAAGEAPVGEQGAGFAQAFGFEVARGVKHFLHAGAAFGAFVADNHIRRPRFGCRQDAVPRHRLGFQTRGRGL